MFRALPHFDRIEINLQNMHGPALRKNEDDHAEYLLRSFRVGEDDAIAAFENIWTTLIARMKGDPWKQTDRAIEELRQKKYPNLLIR